MTMKNIAKIKRPAPGQVLQILDIILRVFSLLETLIRLIDFFKPSTPSDSD
ncbi:MAG: hypothetical protein GX130_03845 [Candidatus Hydrogenedens sp.]|jgi:hypothetical protein|nr:hypothetical protein [Candidatus Hydrogenedens sp.]